MTSEQTLMVHAFLPGATQSVPAGKLQMQEEGIALRASRFVYGLKYLKRNGALEIDPVGLGMLQGQRVAGQALFAQESALFGGIRDAAPDAWGRRVIEAKKRAPANALPESVYLLEAGPNRTGALDITPDGESARALGASTDIKSLGYLFEAAERIENGLPLPANLHGIFDAGSSMGGMRPKATVLIEDGSHWLAKFSSRSDRGFCYPAIEHAALRLAHAAGLDVPETRLEEIGTGHFAMLIKRFDRVGAGETTGRRHFVSALTLMNIHEMASIESSYADLADVMRRHLAAASLADDLKELYRRMVFNILVNNDDDHLRNHGFILMESPEQTPVRGAQEPQHAVNLEWRISPLYDVVPRPVHSHHRRLHLGVGAFGKEATLVNALSWCERFGLNRGDAIAEIDRIWRVVREWRNHFEEHGVAGNDIDAVSSAFLHARDLGGDESGIC
ncbi:HipA domain-containing protein [Enterobacteriaceae bacterium H4N4]|uniref:HipA domain-containing protein n=1 Tax=Silvania confinis TaxID=2926470 RepID=A0A9J6QF44_9ENTR|nr:HipA domain-containing protein [Silvania confinis]MCU6669545.1 HipA domain-containing protein [Silvania confinis]